MGLTGEGVWGLHTHKWTGKGLTLFGVLDKKSTDGEFIKILFNDSYRGYIIYH